MDGQHQKLPTLEPSPRTWGQMPSSWAPRESQDVGQPQQREDLCLRSSRSAPLLPVTCPSSSMSPPPALGKPQERQHKEGRSDSRQRNDPFTLAMKSYFFLMCCFTFPNYKYTLPFEILEGVDKAYIRR